MDAVRGLDDAPFINWFDPAVQADPEPIVRDLRARTAVVRTPLGASVLRRREVQHLLADPRLATAVAHLVRVQSGGDGPLAEMLGDTVIGMDGPDHTRLRRLVGPLVHAAGGGSAPGGDAIPCRRTTRRLCGRRLLRVHG